MIDVSTGVILKDWRFWVDIEDIAWAVLDREGENVIAVDHFDSEELKPCYRLLSNTTKGALDARAAE